MPAVNRRDSLKTGAEVVLSFRGGMAPTAEELRPNACIRITPEDRVALLCEVPELGQGPRAADIMLLAKRPDAEWRSIHVDQELVVPTEYPHLGTGESGATRSTWSVNLKWIEITLFAALAFGQSQTKEAATPKFELSSVKPNKSPDLNKALLQFLPGGRFVATNIPLIQVIAAGWDLALQSQRLELAPGVRMPDDIYDIEATAGEGAIPSSLTAEARTLKMRLMIQALLEDRFKLKIRREPREQPVYALVIAKSGPKLKKSRFQEPKCPEEFGPNFFSNPACHWLSGGQDAGLHGGSVTIASVVEYLQNFTDRPLFDKTGLTDFYDIQTEGWLPMRVPPQAGNSGVDGPDRPTLFEVFEKLGLHMESQRAVIDTFVIDHVEKPHEN